MPNVNDIPAGMRVVTQLPMDAKLWCLTEAILQDLGENNQLAYTYYVGMIVFCPTEQSYWQWRQRVPSETTDYLVAEDFVYPTGHVVDDFPYGDKAFNFFKTQAVQGPPGPQGPYRTITVGVVTTLPEGSSATVTENPSSTPSNLILDFGIPRGGDGQDGQDLTEADFQIILGYPTDFPSNNYIIPANRNKYTLLVANVNNDVTITIDSSLVAGTQGKMFFFIQEGTGHVDFVQGSGATVIFMDNDTTPRRRIKGQGHWASVVQAFGSSTFNVFGSMIPIP